MKRMYKESNLEWLTQEEIEANNESELYMIVQVSERVLNPIIASDKGLTCEIRYLCEAIECDKTDKARKKKK